MTDREKIRKTLDEEVDRFYDKLTISFIVSHLQSKTFDEKGIKLITSKYREFERKRIENGLEESDYLFPPRVIKESFNQYLIENDLEKYLIMNENSGEENEK